jgi:hypothetical protein
MATLDWRALTREASGEQAETTFALRDEGIEVRFKKGRAHFVVVEQRDSDTIRLWARVIGPAMVKSLEEASLRIWNRNRSRDIVGFKIDRQGALIGEAYVPAMGIRPAEWALYVRTVAEVCDRAEYEFSGKDAC